MKAGTQVVAHENLKKNLETYTSNAGKPAVPNVLYNTPSYAIRLGANQVATVHHFDSGHTSGDSMVFFPAQRVIATGDALANAMNCDYAQGGSILSWAKSLEAALKLDWDVAVPGHGPLMTKAEMQAAQTRFAKIASTAIDLVKKGTPKDQLIAQITAADATLNVGQLLQNNQARIDLFYEDVVKAAK
jgi:glyoxylase-like metal-dependent hydrolase (beta-lactamase superfamily II)